MSASRIAVIREKLSNLLAYIETLAAEYSIDLSVPEDAKEAMIEQNRQLGLDANTEIGRIPSNLIELYSFMLDQYSDQDIITLILKLTVYKTCPLVAVNYILSFLQYTVHCPKAGQKVVFDADDMTKLCRYVELFCALVA
jgi:hypothetical protein